MRKVLIVICLIRGFLLTIWYGVASEGHFFNEYKEGHYRCKLCGDEVRAMNKTENYWLSK